MSSGPRIVVLGNSNVDLTSYVARSPEEGETVLAESFVIGMGGKGANQAVAASRAGGAVAFIGSIGRDSFGQLTLESLSQEGLNLDRLVQTDSPTGVATIL
jgi:Sugar kinases, ribokinase family